MSNAVAEPLFTAVPVADAWDETAALRGVAVELGGLAAAHVTPGQVLRVRAPGGGEGYFALASAPRARAELLVKRGAPVADAIIAHARAGATLEVSAPFGRGFPVEHADSHEVLLFAVGSGISPIRALVTHFIATRAPLGRVTLWYGQRGESDFAFAREHDAWTGAGVRLRLCCSGAPSTAWTGGRGHVQDVARLDLAGGSLDGAVAYLCGMKGMVASVRELLATVGVPAERTFLNY
jgi:NAD(P)H-flavin reductase